MTFAEASSLLLEVRVGVAKLLSWDVGPAAITDQPYVPPASGLDVKTQAALQPQFLSNHYFAALGAIGYGIGDLSVLPNPSALGADGYLTTVATVQYWDNLVAVAVHLDAVAGSPSVGAVALDVFTSTVKDVVNEIPRLIGSAWDIGKILLIGGAVAAGAVVLGSVLTHRTERQQ